MRQISKYSMRTKKQSYPDKEISSAMRNCEDDVEGTKLYL